MGKQLDQFWCDKKADLERQLASIVVGPSLEQRWFKQSHRLDRKLRSMVTSSLRWSRPALIWKWRFRKGSVRYSRELIECYLRELQVHVYFRTEAMGGRNAYCLPPTGPHVADVAAPDEMRSEGMSLERHKPVVQIRGGTPGIDFYIGFDDQAARPVARHSKGFDFWYDIHNVPLYHSDDLFPAACAKRWKRIVPFLIETEDLLAECLEDLRTRALADRLRRELASLDAKRAAWNKVHLPDEVLIDVLKAAGMMASGDKAASPGLLLYGPPGTGKTLIARTLAETSGCSFHTATLADLKSENQGGTAKRVSEIWTKLREAQPAILFVDECEGIFPRRGGMEADSFAREMVQTFLGQWDGVAGASRVWVIGATNRRDLLDDAAISRFGMEIAVLQPDRQARSGILRQELSSIGFTGTVPPDFIEATQGLSGRDLAQLAKRAKTLAHPKALAATDLFHALRLLRKRHGADVADTNTWDSLVVDAETLALLQVTCDLLRNAEGWRERGVSVPRGILLTGLPGVGKTQVARTIAHESGLTFLGVTTADLKGGWVGHSAANVKLLFERARSSAPSVIFIDEVDIVAGNRAHSGPDQFVEEIVGQLLQEMDGLKRSPDPVFVLAATNHPDRLEAAILSRFSQTIHLPLPDEQARAGILAILLRGKPLGGTTEDYAVSLAAVCASQAWTGRDLRNWVERAEQKAVRRAIAKGGPQHLIMLMEDFALPEQTTAQVDLKPLLRLVAR